MTEDDPGDCVHDLFAHTMFGDNPLGRPVLGTVDTVNALTADRIRRFYKKHYDPTHLVVAAAGQHRPQQGRPPGPRRLREGGRPQERGGGAHRARATAAAPSAPPAASNCSAARPSRPTSSSACRASPAPTTAAGPSAC